MSTALLQYVWCLVFAFLAGHEDLRLNLVMTLYGTEPNQHLGLSMAGVGDVNRDGLADFLVGDAMFRRCLLYLGGEALDPVADITIALPETCSYPYYGFGQGTSGGHDLNGDGFDDFAITDPEWLWGTGKIFVYEGGSPVNTIPDIGLASSESSWMTFFWYKSIWGALVHDLNGDGFAELACRVLEPVDNGVYIYFGGAPMDSVHDLALRCPERPTQLVGADISSGDANGDGCKDIVVGLFESDAGGGDGAWVYFGGQGIDTIPDVRLHLPDSGWGCVQCVCCDLNGDGPEDIVVAYVATDGRARYLVFFGGATMSGVADLSFTGADTANEFGMAGGDVDMDGFDDLVVVEESHATGICVGRLLVYFGSAATDTSPDIVEEIALGEHDGHLRLAWIGDATGDGYPEFALTNQGLGGWAMPEGEIYIYTMGEVGAEDTPLPRRDLKLRIIPNPTRGPAWIRMTGSIGPDASVAIYDLDGRLVRLLDTDERQAVSAIWWDGRDVQGLAAPPGVYMTRLSGEHRRHAAPIVVVR